MPRFLFDYVELLSYLGDGTPENPGGDFGMCCWIEAASELEALEWGYVLLGNYYQARFARSPDSANYDGSPIREGQIETDPEQLAWAQEQPGFPVCRVGEIPNWQEPWRPFNCS
jgi:hypothetical protein